MQFQRSFADAVARDVARIPDMLKSIVTDHDDFNVVSRLQAPALETFMGAIQQVLCLISRLSISIVEQRAPPGTSDGQHCRRNTPQLIGHSRHLSEQFSRTKTPYWRVASVNRPYGASDPTRNQPF